MNNKFGDKENDFSHFFCFFQTYAFYLVVEFQL